MAKAKRCGRVVLRFLPNCGVAQEKFIISELPLILDSGRSFAVLCRMHCILSILLKILCVVAVFLVDKRGI